MGGRAFLRITRHAAAAGFTAIELVVVVAVIAIIMAASAPFFISYFRTSALRAGAEEMATVLNRARQLAIRDNTIMCVTNDGTRVQYRIGNCGGVVWTGPGTDGAGNITLSSGISANGVNNVCFNYLGVTTATPGPCVNTGTFTVTNPQDGRTLSVTVAPSGRVSIGP